MFSLIFISDGKYGVIDDKTLKVHSLSKESFDAMVLSADEEGVEIRGVEQLSGGLYKCAPVAFETAPNIFNALPYIEKVKLHEKSPEWYGYQTNFYALLSISNGVDKVSDDEILCKIGLFAYYSLRIAHEDRFNQNAINRIIYRLCLNYPRVSDKLYREPFPDNVMQKFCISPIFVDKKHKDRGEV